MMDDNEIKKKLQVCGSISQIYDAIDSNDKLVLVAAATSALTKAECIPIDVEDCLKTMKFLSSSELRHMGNDNYNQGKHRDALLLYNIALTRAETSAEKVMAYGSRAAVMFTMRHFTACYKDLNLCLSIGCNEGLAKKLKDRQKEALLFITEELLHDMMTSNSFINSFFDEFKCNNKRNQDVPCASADVTFSEGAKRATAGKDIRAGTVVAIEKAFVSVAPDTSCTSCYYCHKLTPHLHPCNGCGLALFCTDDCRATCMDEYHRIECQIIEVLFKINTTSVQTGVPLLALRSAIKLSLKMGWDALITASEVIGLSRMRTASVRETYNSDEPLSILSYNDDKPMLEGRMFNGSIFCANVLYCLDIVPDYFPKEPSKRVAAKEAMSRIMMHLYVTFTNTILIRSAAYNLKSKKFEAEVSTNYAWFSMSSKLKHSCEPNLTVVALNDSVALVALKTIKKGEELTISYIDHPYNMSTHTCNTQYSRAASLFQAIRYVCHCQNCIQKKKITHSVKNISDIEMELFMRLKNQDLSETKEFYVNACRALDMFPMHSVQHKLGYDMLRNVIDLAQCKQTGNKVYF